MHAHTIHIITQCNQIMNSKNIKCSFSEGKIKSHENVIISGTYHYMYINTTTGMFTNASKRHPKVIAKHKSSRCQCCGEISQSSASLI